MQTNFCLTSVRHLSVVTWISLLTEMEISVPVDKKKLPSAVADNSTKMSSLPSAMSKEQSLPKNPGKQSRKLLCHNVNPQCVQIMKNQRISGCSILKN